MFSSRFVCLIVRLVCHTWQAYSMTDRIIVVYILTRWCGSLPARLSRMMKYSRREAFVVILSIWSCHVRSCEMVVPSSWVLWTCSIWMSLIVIGGMSGVSVLQHMRICFVLSYFSAMMLVVVHCATSSAAVWSELLTHEGARDSQIVQSSTYLTWSQFVHKSFIWCTKPVGPKIVPYGTPALMVVNLDFTLPIFTRCLRWHKKDVSHLVITFGNPSDAHLVSKIWWFTLSKALLKSTCSIRIVVPLESNAAFHLCTI